MALRLRLQPHGFLGLEGGVGRAQEGGGVRAVRAKASRIVPQSSGKSRMKEQKSL